MKRYSSTQEDYTISYSTDFLLHAIKRLEALINKVNKRASITSQLNIDSATYDNFQIEKKVLNSYRRDAIKAIQLSSRINSRNQESYLQRRHELSETTKELEELLYNPSKLLGLPE